MTYKRAEPVMLEHRESMLMSAMQPTCMATMPCKFDQVDDSKETEEAAEAWEQQSGVVSFVRRHKALGTQLNVEG